MATTFHGNGIFSRVVNGRETFYVKVWIPGEHRTRVWKAGYTLKQAERKLTDVRRDPDKAAAKREEARTAAKQRRAALYTVAQMFDAFGTDYASEGGTGYHKSILKAARESFGDLPAAAVNGSVLAAYVKEREALKRKSDGGRRVGDSTIRKELIGIGTAFAWAKKRGLVKENPASAENIERPREPVSNGHALTDDQLAAVLTASDAWLRNVIAWASETGMDKGKIRSMRWAELDLERANGRIIAGRFSMTRSKTGKPIRQVLSDAAVDALNRAAKVRSADGRIFLDADGQEIQEKVLDWALARVYKTAGVVGCNFRSLRHTYATRALRRGVPREVLAITMGHSTAFITERYMHVQDDQLEAAARAMSGPVRLVRHGDRIPQSTETPVGNRVGNGVSADSAAVPQVLAAQARRGAGVAEQGCLLSSYTG
jgi:integrase